MNMLLSVVTVQRLIPVHRLHCAAVSMPNSTLLLLGRRLPCSAAASMPSSTLLLLGRRLPCAAASMPSSTLLLLGRRLPCAAASMPSSTLLLLGRRLPCAAASRTSTTTSSRDLVLRGVGRRPYCSASSRVLGIGRRPYGTAAPSSRLLVLGIETSCDDTGAAVLDHTGTILGEALHCQNEVHLRTGGIVPPVAQQLHRDHIHRVVQEALDQSGVSPGQLSAVATTVKPGMGLSLGVGLEFSLNLVRKHGLPFIPIHHMEAHALTVRMLRPDLHFPFLVLLVSGGHSLLAVARGVDDFLLLGQSLDEAPGEALDKIARRLSLTKHPECSALSGGQAIELLAKRGERRALGERGGDRRAMTFRTPMGTLRDCNFSFAGFRNHVTMEIVRREQEEGVAEGTLLSCVCDIAAAAQHTVASHLAKRTHRAILFCHSRGLLAPSQPSLVVSGGVASNQYIRRALKVVTEATGLQLICPPAKFCTDNGVMIAWNGVERLREGRGLLSPDVDVRYEPKAPLGVDITAEVKAASIKLPPLQLRMKD